MDTRSPRILISRLSHIGDCILTLPVANTLRAHFPNAYLAWIVERPSDQLLKKHDALDNLIVLDRGWMKSPRRVLRLRNQLRSLHFEITVDPQSLTKSAVPAWLSGARRRLGFAYGIGRELAPVLNNQLTHPGETHVVDRSLELLRTLGIRAPRVEFRVPNDPTACAAIDSYIRQAHLGCGFAVLNPGAGWRSRRWPPSRYARVARQLGQKCGTPSVVTWAGNRERDWAHEIVARSGGHALMAPMTNLTELAMLLKSARLFVGADSAPLHLAAAVGSTCIGLHGTTLPAVSGAYGPHHVPVHAYYHGGSSRQRRKASNEAMLAITTENVFEACEQVLARKTNDCISDVA